MSAAILSGEQALEAIRGNPSLMRVDLDAVMAELGRRSLVDFAPQVYPKLSMDDFHRTYYKVLELFASGTIRRLIVSMPPQHGKSLGASVLAPAWMLGRDPSLKVAVASYNATLAVRFNRQIKKVLSSERYAAMFPASALRDVRPPGSVRTGEQLDVGDCGGGVLAVGREGTLTGNAVDVFILDDLYKDAMEANSPLIRENCWEWYTSVVRTRLHNLSREMVVFTRWHEDDLIGRIMQREPVVAMDTWETACNIPPGGWAWLNFEALKESPPTPLDPRAAGRALWPGRHSEELLDAKRRLDPIRFAALYQGRPSAPEGLLYGDRFLTYDLLPEEVVKKACYIDTADTGDDYLCAACYAVGRDNVIYITNITYSREPMEATEGLVAGMLSEEGTRQAYVESNNGGRGFARALARALPSVAVEWFHQSANKEARILSNAATLLHTVRMPAGWRAMWPEWCAHLTTYRRQFRANRWHDAPDALTGIVERETAQSSNGKIKAVRFLNR